MKKVILTILVISIMLLSFPASVLAAGQSNKPITPPELRDITFIHYVKPTDKPGKPPKEEPEPEGSFKLLGLYQPGTSVYYVNANGAPEGATEEIHLAFESWDNIVTDQELFNNTVGVTSVSGLRQDSQNTISWVKIAPPKAIAVTRLWYLDDGNPATLNPIVEFDMAFNAFFQWGIDLDDEGDAYFLDSAFDVHNIGTHEVGHVIGLGDLYENTNSELTMYGYGRIGETLKISLGLGDIEGAQAIYMMP